MLHTYDYSRKSKVDCSKYTNDSSSEENTDVIDILDDEI